MSIGFGDKPGALSLSRRLAEASARLSRSYERLSSGSRVTSPSDDPVAIALQSRVSTDRRVYTQALRNVNDGISVLNAAEGTLSALDSIANRILELANQAANGTYSASQRAALNTEAQALRNEWNRQIESSKFNGEKLFDGSFTDRKLQAGYGEQEALALSIGGSLFGAQGSGTFESPQTFTGSSTANAITSGDVTGDGSADIVSFSGSTATVWRNNGSGSFSILATHTVGSANRTAQLVDTDNDGKLDLIDGDTSNRNFGVSLGNGNGTFKARLVTTLGGANDPPLNFSTGDLNKDGIVDVMTGDGNDDSTSIFLGNGDGTFKARLSFGGGNRTYGGDIADFNNDGNLDLISGNFFAGSSQLFLGNGNGTFQAPSVWGGNGVDQGSTRALDFNGDGNMDIAWTRSSFGTSGLRLGNGNGTFQASQAMTGSNWASTTADVNGDGYDDFVTTNGDVTFGNASGVPGTAVSAIPGGLVSGTSFGVDVNDFNGDGVLDAVFLSSSTNRFFVALQNTVANSATLADIDLTTQADARTTISTITAALGRVSNERASIGAQQSRLTHEIGFLGSKNAVLAEAESKIRDIEVAEEVASMIRDQILQQTAASLLSKINLDAEIVLKLLAD